MAAVKLEQYLASILDSTSLDTNEIRLKPEGHFNLLQAYLENHNSGIHRYQTSKPTLLYAATGSTKINTNRQNTELEHGNLLILLDKCDYEVEKQDKSAILVKFELRAELAEKFFPGDLSSFNAKEQKVLRQIRTALKTDRSIKLNCSSMSQTSQVMRQIIDEYLKQNLFTRNLIMAEIAIMLISAIRNQEFEQVTAAQHRFAQSALDEYIDRNFSNITLNEAAKHFGLNPNYFSSLVKQKTGKSFVEHVDERRMQEARNLLARPDISVKEVIARVGYSGKSFFYKKFNEYYHETPVQMRAELFRQANINLK